MKHELWLSQQQNSYTFCLAGSRGDSARNLLEPDAKLVWTCESVSYFDAMTQYYKYMGWGEYKSDDPESDSKTYKELGWE